MPQPWVARAELAESWETLELGTVDSTHLSHGSHTHKALLR